MFFGLFVALVVPVLVLAADFAFLVCCFVVAVD